MAYAYTPPGEIDGDPQEVETAVKQQLVAVIEETAVQLRSSYLSGVLRGEPNIDPEELSYRWNESDERAAIERIRVLAEQL